MLKVRTIVFGPAPGPIESLPLVVGSHLQVEVSSGWYCWSVTWVGRWVFFWKTAPTIFLIFGIKLLLDKWKKVTKPDFS